MDEHLSPFRGSVASYLVLAALLLLPTPAWSEPLLTATPLPSGAAAPATVTLFQLPQPTWLSQAVKPSGGDSLKHLKLVFIASEALDVHSTLSAIGGDAREGNRLMRPMTGSTAVFLAVKAAATWVTLRAADRLATRNRKGAAWLLGASSAALSIVAVRNYRIR